MPTWFSDTVKGQRTMVYQGGGGGGLSNLKFSPQTSFSSQIRLGRLSNFFWEKSRRLEFKGPIHLQFIEWYLWCPCRVVKRLKNDRKKRSFFVSFFGLKKKLSFFCKRTTRFDFELLKNKKRLFFKFPPINLRFMKLV